MSETKVLKKLGEGYEGEVFLIKKNNVPMIRKIFRVGPFVDRMDMTSPFWREIDFSKFSSNYPQYFMQLKYFGIDKECSVERKTPKWFKDVAIINQWKKFQKESPYCGILDYTPVLDGKLSEIYTVVNKKYLPLLNRETWQFPNNFYKISYELLLQQVYILYLLAENDYIHRDAHNMNWLYKKNSSPIKLTGLDKTITVLCPYRLLLCDYGLITHKSYPLGPSDSKGFVFENFIYSDVIQNIMNNVYDVEWFDFLAPNSTKFIKKVNKAAESKKLKYRPSGDKEIDKHMMRQLYRMMYPDEYCALADNPKFTKANVHYPEWEIEFIQFVCLNYHRSQKIIGAIQGLIKRFS
jgi:hypothetical protein